MMRAFDIGCLIVVSCLVGWIPIMAISVGIRDIIRTFYACKEYNEKIKNENNEEKKG